MPTLSQPFYGCLCFETSSSNTSFLPSQRGGSIPLPEIHFNIWEEGTNTAPFLDIGLMLAVNDPAEQIEIFLPWELGPNSIEDLSSRILGSYGVSAVFNEAWTSTSSASSPGGYVRRDNGTAFTIVKYNSPKIATRTNSSGENYYSIVLNLNQLRSISQSASLNASPLPDQMYLRIRVKGVPISFYQVGMDQGDFLGGGVLNRTEIIDFRLNVRRGVPPAIESDINGRFLEFSKVQLFLMKSRDQDIVFEDKLFKACRSLEDENFWAEYILPKQSPRKAIDKSLKQVKASLGYQWRKTPEAGPSGSVKEFGILARFKSVKLKKRFALLFVFVALIVGALGNAVYDFAKDTYAASKDANSKSTSKKIDSESTSGNLKKEGQP